MCTQTYCFPPYDELKKGKKNEYSVIKKDFLWLTLPLLLFCLAVAESVWCIYGILQ